MKDASTVSLSCSCSSLATQQQPIEEKKSTLTIEKKSAIIQFISDHPEVYIKCKDNPNLYEYCQKHYVFTWDSESKQFSVYKKTPFISDVVPDYTVATHASVNRLHFLTDIRKRWTGPISLSISAKWSDIPALDAFFSTCNYTNLRITIYLVDDRLPFESGDNCVYKPIWKAELKKNVTVCVPMKNSIYPINTLRNLAINNIFTSHYMNLDMDLWPSYGLYESMKAIDPQVVNVDKMAFVLPAFQFKTTVREICKTNANCFVVLKKDLPRNKEELLQCMHRDICQIANARLPTHRFVDAAWWNEKNLVQQLKCIPFAIMEPYVMMKRTLHSPMYNDNFINYGYNKVQFIDELEYKGYVFAVLTGGFGFDIPHKPSVYADMYEESWRVNNVINLDVYDDFRNHLYKQMNQTRQSICDRNEALKQYKGVF